MLKKQLLLNPLISLFIVFIFALSALARPSAPDIKCITWEAPSFQLTGNKGVFLANEIAQYSIATDRKILIQFSASPLTYKGPYPERAALENIVYWANDNTLASFQPGNPLAFEIEAGDHIFSIRGKLTIEALEAQPAGDYAGEILITLFAAR